MKKKLTLRMDDKVIKEIKKFSKKHDTSVSKLTEQLYDNIVEYEEQLGKVSEPITKKYKGIISGKKIDTDQAKFEHLSKKHK